MMRWYRTCSIYQFINRYTLAMILRKSVAEKLVARTRYRSSLYFLRCRSTGSTAVLLSLTRCSYL